jgi:thymidylate synthase ThyX
MQTFEDLSHVIRDISDETSILILNTGAVITPEATAMLQAKYSRSLGGARAQLRQVGKRGSREFMQMYYIGYGDKSIGDCGTTTVFVDGVSMLCAKAIQDTPLYNGQESSTRYIPFESQRFVDPIGTNASHQFLERWRTFYLACQEPVREYLQNLFPFREEYDEKDYKKAISARAFDITRGFLPAGASTNVTWHGPLRVFADHLLWLRHHPLEEVRVVAETMIDGLQEAHPDSFNQKRYPETEAYTRMCMEEFYYLEQDHPFEDVELLTDTIKSHRFTAYSKALARRPQKAELPKFMRAWGDMEFGFMLDFGSFRDTQRNRAVIQRMPLVTTRHGFEEWYLESLPGALRVEAEGLLRTQELRLRAHCKFNNLSKEVEQYYIPMGYKLPNIIAGDLPALVWYTELRGTRHIHPTLRTKVRRIADIMMERLAECGLVLHMDDEPDKFDTRRGAHDIVERS